MWWGHEFQPIWNCQAVRMRYNVVIKRGGMMIMYFDSRLPRQERPSQKRRSGERESKRESERARESENRSNVTSLPGRAMKNLSALQHITVCSFQLCIFHWTKWAGGILPADRCKYLSFYMYNVWFNVPLFWYVKKPFNNPCSFIINHKLETLSHTLSKLEHQLKLNK